MRATIPLIALATLILSSGAAAAPLCRDSKGLFTPCAGATAPAARHAGHGAAAALPAGGPSAAGPTRTASASARPARLSLFGRGRSCRDAKGLFKPC